MISNGIWVAFNDVLFISSGNLITIWSPSVRRYLTVRCFPSTNINPSDDFAFYDLLIISSRNLITILSPSVIIYLTVRCFPLTNINPSDDFATFINRLEKQISSFKELDNLFSTVSLLTVQEIT